jgi:CheY-like chemotaxis protein
VDDDPNAREILHDYLTYWGMRGRTSASSEQALELLNADAQTDPYAVAIVDLAMPGTDGMRFGKKIRESAALKNTKLILATAFDKPGIGEEAISLGFDAYLTKPSRPPPADTKITKAFARSYRDPRHGQIAYSRSWFEGHLSNSVCQRYERDLLGDRDCRSSWRLGCSFQSCAEARTRV